MKSIKRGEEGQYAIINRSIELEEIMIIINVYTPNTRAHSRLKVKAKIDNKNILASDFYYVCVLITTNGCFHVKIQMEVTHGSTETSCPGKYHTLCGPASDFERVLYLEMLLLLSCIFMNVINCINTIGGVKSIINQQRK